MNTKKGITLLMLAIVVIIMITLTTVTITTGTDMYNTTKKVKLQSEINQLEILVENYIKRSSGIPFEIVELDISSYSDEEKSQFSNENIVDNKIELYVVDIEAVDAEELIHGTQKEGLTDRYLYSSTTSKIYYELGETIGDTIYHRVDNMEEN